MRKNRVFIIGFVVLSGLWNAQFNTIRPIASGENKTPKIDRKADQGETSGKKNGKRFRKQLSENQENQDQKRQLDSLKAKVDMLLQEKYDRWRDLESLIKKLRLNSSIKKDEIEEPHIDQINTIHDLKFKSGTISSKFVMPLKNKMIVTSPYGIRAHPLLVKRKMHSGIDLKAYYENIYSVMDGVVTEAGKDYKGGGNFIRVLHYDRFETSYLHLSEIYYQKGERVKAGYVIGKSGNSGNSTGPHLHFAVKEFGIRLNPSEFLKDLRQINNLTTMYK